MHDDRDLRGAPPRRPVRDGAPRIHGGRALSPSAAWVPCAARLAREMAARGFDAARLSVETGFTVREISSWLRCDSVPAADELARVCRALGASADRILGLSGGSL